MALVQATSVNQQDLKAILHKRDSCRALLSQLEAGKVDLAAHQAEKETSERSGFLMPSVGGPAGDGAIVSAAPSPAIKLRCAEVEAPIAGWTTDKVIEWLKSF